MDIRNPEIRRNIFNITSSTATDALPTKIKDRVQPIIDVTPKNNKYTINHFSSVAGNGSLTVPANKKFYITYAFTTADLTGTGGNAYITLTADTFINYILFVQASGGTLTDAVATSATLNYNPPIECKAGDVVNCSTNGCGFGGYFTDDY
jgi:hypothetical protein